MKSSIIHFCTFLCCSLPFFTIGQLPSTLPNLPVENGVNSTFFQPSTQHYSFVYEGENTGKIEYLYDANFSGTFGELTVIIDDAYAFNPSNSGGAILETNDGSTISPWDAGTEFTRTGISTQQDTLLVNWLMENEAIAANYQYKIYLAARSLIVEISSNSTNIVEFTLDRSENTPNSKVIHVPNLTNMNVLLTNDVFVSAFFDWESTRSSGIYEVDDDFSATSKYYAPYVRYDRKTDGSRNLLRETVMFTVSPLLEEVLPNIPNPISPYKEECAKYLVFDVWEEDFNEAKMQVEQMAAAGLEDLWVIDHVWQQGGYDNMFPDVVPANALAGGATGMQALSAAAADANYLFALHENYVDYYTNAPSWDDNKATKLSDGSLRTGWFNVATGIQAFQISPHHRIPFHQNYAPTILNDYSVTAGYLDVHSAANPSNQVDFAANSEDAGLFLKALWENRWLVSEVRSSYGGPVSGEGGAHFYYVGYFDDIEAQINVASQREETMGRWLPLLLDFDLLKMHDKMVAHGVGYYERFFSASDNSSVFEAFSIDQALEYVATELAYGHAGFIPTPEMSADIFTLAQIEKEHVQSVQVYFYDSPVAAIEYFDDGNWVDASTYIKNHPENFNKISSPEFMSQVSVTYQNGVKVFVNRNPFNNLTIAPALGDGLFNYHILEGNTPVRAVNQVGKTTYVLPNLSGWLVYVPDELLTTTSAVPLVEKSSSLVICPNPISSDVLNIVITSEKTQKAHLEIVNILGQKINTKHIFVKKGVQVEAFDIQGVKSGQYQVIIRFEDGEVINSTLVKLK